MSKTEEKLNAQTARFVMDHAASMLERLRILGKALPAPYKKRVDSAIKLLRNPPKRNRGMRG